MPTPTSVVPSGADASATPLSSAPPGWNSEPAWKLPEWGEPVVSTYLHYPHLPPSLFGRTGPWMII